MIRNLSAWPFVSLLVLLALFLLMLTGCINSSRDANTATVRQEVRRGVEAGKPVDMTITTREQVQEQSQAQSTVDTTAMIQAGFAAIRGDFPGMIRAGMPPPQPIDFTPILSRLDAKAPATDWATIIGGGTAALLGGGYGVMKAQDAKRQRLDAERQRIEADQAWEQNQRALALLPPDQAAKVLGV